MKNILHRIAFVLAAALVLVSCETEYIMFDSSKVFVAFPGTATSVAEQGGMVAIPVYVVAMEGAPSCTVDFDFDATDIANAAVEGEDFTLVNDSKTLSFPNGWGYDTIWIQPIDNDLFEGNKLVNVVLTSNSQNYPFGAHSTNAMTFIDNEHPLKAWIGSYSVESVSYGNPGGWDEAWSVTITSVDGDLESLMVTIDAGSGGGIPFKVGIDTEAMTITIPSGTDVGAIYGYGPTLMYVGDYSYIDKETDLVGTISEDGTIAIDEVAMWLPNYAYYWDAFNTTWTKTGKKAVDSNAAIELKAERLK